MRKPLLLVLGLVLGGGLTAPAFGSTATAAPPTVTGSLAVRATAAPVGALDWAPGPAPAAATTLPSCGRQLPAVSTTKGPYAEDAGTEGPATKGLGTEGLGTEGPATKGLGTEGLGTEGLVRLRAAAPGTDWAFATSTAVVVDVRVDTGPASQLVLFGGARAYDYVAFTGPLTRGPHCVTVTVRPDLSATMSPAVTVYGVDLGVVPASDPDALTLTHAPVLYGRSTSASSDTPLVTYGTRTSRPDGTVDLAYTVTWTHEDVGTALVPADEWGRYGRMTDIETVLHEHVAADGTVLSASYLSCGCEAAPVYPDLAPEAPPQGETDQPFTGGYDGQHAILRVATGNNDISPSGTTAFRFQQALVRAPRPGQSREVVMDEHPWTYQLSDDELSRQDVRSTDPRDLLPGDYRQYLVVDIDATTSGTTGVGIEVQLRGDPTWYSDDYEQMTAGVPSTYPFYDGGHRRTVVKLPRSWQGSGIATLRLRYDVPPGGPAAPVVTVRALQLLAVTEDWQVVPVAPDTTLAPRTVIGLFPRPIA